MGSETLHLGALKGMLGITLVVLKWVLGALKGMLELHLWF